MSPAIESFLIQFVVVPASALGAVLLARALHKLGNYLHAKHEEVKASALESRFFAAAEVLANCAGDAVTVMEDTVRPSLKAATADGQISKEEGAALKAQAVATAKAQAKAAAPKILEAAGLNGDLLDSFLSHLVDVAAAKLAGDSRSATPPLSASSDASAASGAPVDPSKASP